VGAQILFKLKNLNELDRKSGAFNAVFLPGLGTLIAYDCAAVLGVSNSAALPVSLLCLSWG
jgi:hypothetical protein